MRLLAVFCLVACLGAGPAIAQAPPARPSAEAPPAPRWQRYPRAQEVVLQNIAAYVRVRPEDRSDVAIIVRNQGPLPAPTLRSSGRRLVIDGRQRGRLRGCEVRGASGFEVEIARQGRLSGAQLPVIELRVPEDAEVRATGAIRMHVASAENAEVRLDGCGDVDIERVEGVAEVSIAHDADLRIGEVGDLIAALAGDGDINAGIVRDSLTVSVAGAGRFEAARADGPTNVVVQGSGGALIRSGAAEDMTVIINGAGQVTHSGSAETLDAFIVGRGIARVGAVEGEISRRVFGGGQVIIGR